MWDKLPISEKGMDSIIRFDHIQPVGRSQDSIAYTDYSLSERALLLMDEWLEWLITGILDSKSKLCEIGDALTNHPMYSLLFLAFISFSRCIALDRSGYSS